MSCDSIVERMKVNPFFGSNKDYIDDDIIITQRNFFKYYKKIYLILPLKKAKSSWFDNMISVDDMADMYDNCMVLEKSTTLAKVNIFFEWMKTISIVNIKKCKTGTINFDDIETSNVLILPLFLISYENMLSFMEMYNEKDWFENFLIKEKLCDYLKISKKFYEIRNSLETSPLTYWCKQKHINVTDLFLQRNFRWNVFKSSLDPTKIKTIEEMKRYKIDDDSYISMYFKTKGNFDDKFGKINFFLHRLPKIKNIINNEQLIEIMSGLSNKNRFQLFFNLMVSPQYCHLILNNKDVWVLMDSVVNRCLPLVRYCLFYSYMSLYLQENIKKTYLRREDTCILKLSNVCHIPNFPYLQSDIESHPAIAAAHLIKKTIIPNENFYGISYIRDKNNLARDENTLNDIETFRKRLNIFITGFSDKNILSNIDWTNIHITGSIMAACIPKRHALVNLFRNTSPCDIYDHTDYLYHRYFCEYYGDSDIDVLINISEPIKLYERVLKFKENLEKGLRLYDMDDSKIDTILDKIRKGYFKFNYSFIVNKLLPYWSEKGTDLTYDDIISNLSNPKYGKYFMPFYLEAQKKFYDNFRIINEIDEEDDKYKFFFSNIDVSDIMFNLYQLVDGRYYKVDSEDINMMKCKDDISPLEKSEDDPYYEVIESTKYRIHHPKLNHPFELFGVPHEDPWACINKFHIGCVRAYYDGIDVHMTTSALMTFHTNLSPDYRIMYGSKDPADICNKYRMRGYGLLLNRNELAQLITYSECIPYWNNLYHINKKNIKTISEFLGKRKITDDLFKPRLYNSDYYKDSNCFVHPIYNDIHTSYIESKSQLQSDLDSYCKVNSPMISDLFFKNKFLNVDGKPNVLKRWLIDASWDIFEMEKIFVD